MTEVIYDSGFADLDPLAANVEIETTPRTCYYWAVTVRTDADEEATSATDNGLQFCIRSWFLSLLGGLRLCGYRNPT